MAKPHTTPKALSHTFLGLPEGITVLEERKYTSPRFESRWRFEIWRDQGSQSSCIFESAREGIFSYQARAKTELALDELRTIEAMKEGHQ